MNYMQSATERDSLKIVSDNTLSGNALGTLTGTAMVLLVPIDLSQYGLLEISSELPDFYVTGAGTMIGTSTLQGRVNGVWVNLVVSTLLCAVSQVPAVSAVITLPTTGVLDALRQVQTLTNVNGGAVLNTNWISTLYFQFGLQESIQTAA